MEDNQKSNYCINSSKIISGIAKLFSYDVELPLAEINKLKFQLSIALLSKQITLADKIKAYQQLFNLSTLPNANFSLREHYIVYKLMKLLRKHEDYFTELRFSKNSIRALHSSSLYCLSEKELKTIFNKDKRDLEEAVYAQTNILLQSSTAKDSQFNLGNVVLAKVLASNGRHYKEHSMTRSDLIKKYIRTCSIGVNSSIAERNSIIELFDGCIRTNYESLFPVASEKEREGVGIADTWSDAEDEQYKCIQYNEEDEEETDGFENDIFFERLLLEEEEREDGQCTPQEITPNQKSIRITNNVFEIPLIKLKAVIFCAKLLRSENIPLLRPRTLKVKPTISFEELKAKVLKILQISNVTKVKKQITLYKLHKEKAELLAELLIAYSSRIPFFQVYCTEIKGDDAFSVSTLIPYYIIISINDMTEVSFISLPPFDKCAKCNKPFSIPASCSYCSYNHYCSNHCLASDFNHNAYHDQYNAYFGLFQNNQMMQIPKTQSFRIGTAELPNGRVGLKNTKSASFANSVLQSLSNTTDLKYYFIFNQYEQDLCTSSSEIIVQLNALLQKLWVEAKMFSSVSASEFWDCFVKECPLITNDEFQDAFFFLSYLLDAIHLKLKREKVSQSQLSMINEEDDSGESSADKDNPPTPEAAVYQQALKEFNLQLKSDNSIITDLFKGQYTTFIKCSMCGQVRHNFEEFRFIQLNIPKERFLVSFYFIGLSNRVESFKITVFATTKVKSFKDIISRSYPQLTFDLIEGVLLSKQRTIQSLIEDEFLAWEVYTTKKSIIFYEKKPKEMRSLYYCANNPSSADSSLPYRLSLDDDTIKLQSCFFPIRNNLLKLAKDLGACVFKIHHFNKKVVCDYCNKSGADCEVTATQSCTSIREILDKGKGLYYFVLIAEIPNFVCGIVPNTVIKGVEDEISLSECFDLFHSYETIPSLDCPNCKVPREVEKKTMISVYPKYLIIQLKKSKDKKGLLGKFKTVKIDSLIQIPLNGFNVKDYAVALTDSRSVYDLYSIVNHDNAGLYTSLCLNEQNWMSYKDEQVRVMADNEAIVTKDAYLLFYRNVKDSW